MKGQRDGSVDMSTCCTRMMTWFQILSVHINKQLLVWHMLVTPALISAQVGRSQEELWGLLATSLVLGRVRAPVLEECGRQRQSKALGILYWPLCMHRCTHTKTHTHTDTHIHSLAHNDIDRQTFTHTYTNTETLTQTDIHTLISHTHTLTQRQ